MVITFAGHADVFANNRIKELIKEQIRNHAIGADKITCYLGGYGGFDRICACACRELKTEYPNIEIVYVTPYMRFSEQKKIEEMQNLGLYDTSIFPPMEGVHPRLAVLKRNEWMISNADLIIAYVERSYGGAYRSLQIAKHQKKKIVNICNLG